MESQRRNSSKRLISMNECWSLRKKKVCQWKKLEQKTSVILLSPLIKIDSCNPEPFSCRKKKWNSMKWRKTFYCFVSHLFIRSDSQWFGLIHSRNGKWNKIDVKLTIYRKVNKFFILIIVDIVVHAIFVCICIFSFEKFKSYN